MAATNPKIDMAHTAIVIKSTGSWYTLSDLATGERAEARIRGRLRLRGTRSTNPVVVGDVVDYESDESGGPAITRVHERRNYMIRRSPNLSRESHIIAANIDQALLVVTLDFPVTNCEFIDRFLVTAEAYKIPVTIVLNKCDLYTEAYGEQLAAFLQTYGQAGYPVLAISARNPADVGEVRALLRGRTTLVSGNSGVGKSTLIRAVEPTAELRTGDISDATGKGRHTTTFSQMYPLADGGYIIDTPGIKGFGLIDIAPDEVCRYFPDLFRYAPDCQFYNCTHTHEPRCAVIDAVARGDIGESRYISYLKILDEDSKYRK